MTSSVQLKIDVPIRSVNMVEEFEDEISSMDPPETADEAPNRHDEHLAETCRALEAAARRLNDCCEEIVSSHRDQIVRLSVEIAAKILLKEISGGNYEIEKIVAEALKTAPAQHDVVVRLNPADLQRYQERFAQTGGDPPANVKLVADPAIGCAECVVETDKGIVEYFVEEHLRQVKEALEAME